MRRIIFGVILLFVISCNEKPKEEFSLSGITNEIKDGTTIYLSSDNKVIDSAKVANNAFNFQTKLLKLPFRALLRTSDFSQRRVLWLENSSMIFDASKSDFKNAEVIGSEPERLSQSLYKKLDTIPRPWLKYEIDFVKTNPNSIVSARLLSIYSTTIGKEKTIELFGKFSVENKNSEYGKSISKYTELNKNPQIGEKYVDFEMEDTNGKTRKISDFKDKLVLLEFWASNCWPCRQENPNLVKTYEKYKPKGFEIFAVSMDKDKNSWLKAIEKDNLNWKHVSELNGQENTAGLIYGVNGIPDNFLIAENGTILGRNLRGEKLNEKLKEILE